MNGAASMQTNEIAHNTKGVRVASVYRLSYIEHVCYGYGIRFKDRLYIYVDSMLEMCKISYDILTPNVCKTRSTNVSQTHSFSPYIWP